MLAAAGFGTRRTAAAPRAPRTGAGVVARIGAVPTSGLVERRPSVDLIVMSRHRLAVLAGDGGMRAARSAVQPLERAPEKPDV